MPCALRTLRREKAALGEAHHSKQGEGVVPYVEPLARSNDAMRRLF